MSRDEIHRAVSEDGTRIAARVEGHGPPLVLVHGGLGDGEVSNLFMLPYLVDHFTCFMMSTRGRALSDDNPDHSRDRHFGDVAAFVESLDEPAFVFGHSMGAVWVLGGAAPAAARVRGVALYEPAIPVPGWAPALDGADLLAAMAEGRMADAVRITVSDCIRLNDYEQAFILTQPALEIAERNLSVAAHDAAALNHPLDDIALEELTMPVLLIGGARSGPHFKEGTRLLAERIDHAGVVEIPGAGHLGPLTHAEVVANNLVRFFHQSESRSTVAARSRAIR
jgi:pimeloyl-ACP methyl ester carboxylesterase